MRGSYKIARLYTLHPQKTSAPYRAHPSLSYSSSPCRGGPTEEGNKCFLLPKCQAPYCRTVSVIRCLSPEEVAAPLSGLARTSAFSQTSGSP